MLLHAFPSMFVNWTARINTLNSNHMHRWPWKHA